MSSWFRSNLVMPLKKLSLYVPNLYMPGWTRRFPSLSREFLIVAVTTPSAFTLLSAAAHISYVSGFVLLCLYSAYWLGRRKFLPST